MRLLIYIFFLLLIMGCVSTNKEQSKVSFVYPGGKTKAVLLSYDDGVDSDRRFVELLNKYNLKGTFNLNDGYFGTEVIWLAWKPQYINASEVKVLYDGHEVALHTTHHPDMTYLSKKLIEKEINSNKKALEELTGVKIHSLAYPFGNSNDRVANVLQELGVTSARLVGNKSDFSLPENWLLWNPTTHHSKAKDIIDRYLALESHEPTVLYIWGHSWELDQNNKNNSWEYFQELCEKLSGQQDIWYTTVGEFVNYVREKRGY